MFTLPDEIAIPRTRAITIDPPDHRMTVRLPIETMREIVYGACSDEDQTRPRIRVDHVDDEPTVTINPDDLDRLRGECANRPRFDRMARTLEAAHVLVVSDGVSVE